jgi:hypothetical protein
MIVGSACAADIAAGTTRIGGFQFPLLALRGHYKKKYRSSGAMLISMPMYVVHIGYVGMSMFNPPVFMEMSMGFPRGF